MNTKPLRFFRRGAIVTLPDVEPNRTLLELLREDLHCTGTKEGCGEGDCGACTVVVGEADGEQLKYSAINSCIPPRFTQPNRPWSTATARNAAFAPPVL